MPSLACPACSPICSAAVALNRTAPGRLGMLCPVVPSDQPAQNCAANYTCAPLPQLSPNVSTSLAGLGFCTEEPAGGTFGSLQYLQVSAARQVAARSCNGRVVGSESASVSVCHRSH